MKATLLGGAALSLLSVSAFAADLAGAAAPTRRRLSPGSSCYGGGQAGGGWGQKNLTDSAGVLSPITGFSSANLNISGYMLGGQFGCDYQFAPNWVAGIEGAAAGGNIGGNISVAQPLGIAGDSANFKETTDLLTSVTGRVGYAWDRWLVYAKGGAAWASDRYSAFGTFGGVPYDLEGSETSLSAGPRASASSGRSGMIGRSGLNTTITASVRRSVTFIDNVHRQHRPREHQPEHSDRSNSGLNFHVCHRAGRPVEVVRQRMTLKLLAALSRQPPTERRGRRSV